MRRVYFINSIKNEKNFCGAVLSILVCFSTVYSDRRPKPHLTSVPIVFLLISNENGSISGFFRGRKGRMAPHTAKHHQENVSSLLPFCASRLTG